MTGISVVIVHRNRPTFLEAALKSASEQTLPPLEIIIVDNASDATPIVPQTSGVPVRLISLPKNLGPSAARNVGAHAAAGDFIAFLDDDDIWLPEKLSRQNETLASQAADAVLCGYVQYPRQRSHTNARRKITVRELRHGNRLCGASGLFIRRSVYLKELMDEDCWLGEDWDLYIRLALHHSLVNIPAALFQYHVSEQSISNQAAVHADWRIESKVSVLKRRSDDIGGFFSKVRLAGLRLRFFGARKRRAAVLYEVAAEVGLWPLLYYLCGRVQRRLGLSA